MTVSCTAIFILYYNLYSLAFKRDNHQTLFSKKMLEHLTGCIL